LLLANKGGGADEAVGAFLVPYLVNFATQPADAEGLEESRASISTTLANWVPTVSQAKIAVAMALILPTLLARAESEGSAVYPEVAGSILQLAGGEQTKGVFRNTVAGLDGQQRALLERVLREGATRERKEVREEGGEPSIALKMEF
jgi:hypothetical protein